jgi:hypothetical protein
VKDPGQRVRDVWERIGVVYRADAEPMYEAANLLFRDRCLRNGRSYLWPEHRAWIPENISALLDAITGENADTGGRTFYQTLRDQLAEQPEEVHRVAAGIIAYYYLFPIKIGRQKKLDYITQ